MSASARLDELRKRYDENPRRFFAPLANEFRKAGDLDMAIGLCERHLAEQPTNMNGHVVYGQALFEAGRLDDARTTFATAISLDPENLIALRHLGDIARLNGDPNGARGWFRRILDADPRNDEILAFLVELDAAAAIENATPLIAQRAVETVPPAVPDPSTARTVEIVPPVIARPSADETALALEVFGSEAAPEPVAPPEPRPSMALLDLPDFGDLPGFNETPLEGIAADAELATPDTIEPLRAIDTGSTFGPLAEEYSASDTPVFGFESTSAMIDEGPIFEAPVFEASVVESVAMDAPIFDTPVQEPEAADVVEPAMEPVLESVMEPVTEPTVEPAIESLATPAPEPAVMFDEMLVDEDEAAAPAEGAHSPFVTATMAELYLQQGHAERALEVYQQLAEQRPDDEALKMRIRALMPTPIIPTITQEFATPVTAFAAVTGPTAREFFAAFAWRTPGATIAATPAMAFEATAEPWEESPAPADSAAPHPDSTIDALFGHVTPDAEDEEAARVLASYIQHFEGA